MISRKLFGEIEKYIVLHYEPGLIEERQDAIQAPVFLRKAKSLDEVLAQREETFSERLLRLIDESGMTDVEVYKRAHVDRRNFSKIRSNTEYRPSKNTAVALCLGLHLSVDSAKDLLDSAGYSLSKSIKSDLIVMCFLEKEIYNIDALNDVLDQYGYKILL